MEKELETLKQYYALVSDFDPDVAKYKAVLHPDIVQTEYPDLVTGFLIKERGFDKMMEGVLVGKSMMKTNTFELVNTFVDASKQTIIQELIWRGELSITAGPFVAGQVLTAYVNCITEFKDGLIIKQRNYDCYLK